MAQALELYFHLPLAWGYLLCTIAIFPLVVFGMTLLATLQVWTQPIWLLGMFAPWIAVLMKDPQALSTWTSFAGKSTSGSGFDPLLCASGVGVALSLIAQIGEQVDYLRFMPDLTSRNKGKWWWAVMLAGPGWVILDSGATKSVASLKTLEKWQNKAQEQLGQDDILAVDTSSTTSFKFGNGGVLDAGLKIHFPTRVGHRGVQGA